MDHKLFSQKVVVNIKEDGAFCAQGARIPCKEKSGWSMDGGGDGDTPEALIKNFVNSNTNDFL